VACHRRRQQRVLSRLLFTLVVGAVIPAASICGHHHIEKIALAVSRNASHGGVVTKASDVLFGFVEYVVISSPSPPIEFLDWLATASVGSLLRDISLPKSNANGAEGSDDQRPRKQNQPPIRLDLGSCELMLLILAALAGDLFLAFRFIKNDSAPFLVEGSGAAILFVVGQFAAHLFSRRIYGL
jgi:hypothetical protein